MDGIEVLEHVNHPRFDELANAHWTARQRKGVTRSTARAQLENPIFFAAMMLREGLADGMVGGPGKAYKTTLRPALKILGLGNDTRLASGVYAMIFEDRKVFFGDCTVNINPNAEQLAAIALNTAAVAETFGQKPRVAMLSYSDFGEHKDDPQVEKVRRAVELVREQRPDLEIDGEMQADTAVNYRKSQDSFPFSALNGPANVLIFPDLTSGNIAYKLLIHLSGAEALGPLLTGAGAPVNVIPVDGSVTEIVNVATYTANQALDARAAKS